MAKRIVKKDSEEALRSKVLRTGAGEDPVIKDLVGGKMAGATDSEALDMALALRQIIRGQEMTLEQLKRQEQEIAKLKEEAAARDKANEKWQTDQQKFMQEVMDRAESLKATGDQLDKIKANAAAETQKAYQQAMAAAKSDALKFEQELARMPKVTVTSGGVPKLTHSGGRPSVVLLPEEVRIKHRRWSLQPGVPTEVPEVVAKALENRKKDKRQQRQLEQALQADLEASELNKRMAEIRKDEVPYDPNKVTGPIN